MRIRDIVQVEIRPRPIVPGYRVWIVRRNVGYPVPIGEKHDSRESAETYARDLCESIFQATGNVVALTEGKKS